MSQKNENFTDSEKSGVSKFIQFGSQIQTLYLNARPCLDVDCCLGNTGW